MNAQNHRICCNAIGPWKFASKKSWLFTTWQSRVTKASCTSRLRTAYLHCCTKRQGSMPYSASCTSTWLPKHINHCLRKPAALPTRAVLHICLVTFQTCAYVGLPTIRSNSTPLKTLLARPTCHQASKALLQGKTLRMSATLSLVILRFDRSKSLRGILQVFIVMVCNMDLATWNCNRERAHPLATIWGSVKSPLQFTMTVVFTKRTCSIAIICLFIYWQLPDPLDLNFILMIDDASDCLLWLQQPAMLNWLSQGKSIWPTLICHQFPRCESCGACLVRIICSCLKIKRLDM